jgi:hypothetical protein
MIAVIVRQGEIGDIARRVADLCKLRQQGLGDCEGALRRGARSLELAVGDFAGIPHQRTAWMHDQITRCDHLGILELAGLESKLGFTDAGDLAAVQDIQPQRLRGLRCAFLLRGGQRQYRGENQRRREQSETQSFGGHARKHIIGP